MIISDLAGPLPLSHYKVMRTTDVDEATSRARQLFGDIRLTFETPPRHFEYALNEAQVGQTKLSIHEQVLGGRAQVSLAPNPDVYVLEVPILGETTMVCGTQRVSLTPGQTGALNNPKQPTLWENSGLRYRAMTLFLERKLVDYRYQLLTGIDRFQTIEFSPELDFRTPEGLGFLRALVGLVQSLDAGDAIFSNEVTAALYEDFLINVLLTCFPHSRSTELDTDPALAARQTIRQAEDFFHEHADTQITISDVAAKIGVSVRSLQRTFQAELNTSPMRVLKSIRLDRARARLMSGGPKTNVTQVALTSGFTHLGAFASDYRKRFGESPSETMHRQK